MSSEQRPNVAGGTAAVDWQKPPPRDTPALGSLRSPFAGETEAPTAPMARLDSMPATGGIELVVVEEPRGAIGARWHVAEVWTKRRVYHLDAAYTCVEVLDRETGRLEPGHEMLGARLGGGRAREGDKARFSVPLPLPGMEAMFMKAKKHGYTSTVERMVVRVRVVETGANEAVPSWDELAARWSELPPRP